MMMGYCIAEWARVDEQLFQIFHMALQCPKKQAAVVYYRTNTLGGRLALASALVSALLPKTVSGEQSHDDRVRWNEVKTAINSILGTRNRIAHKSVNWHQAPQFIDANAYLDVAPDSSFDIFENENERLVESGEPQKPLTLSDLQTHAQLTLHAWGLLYRFYCGALPKHVVVPPP